MFDDLSGLTVDEVYARSGNDPVPFWVTVKVVADRLARGVGLEWPNSSEFDDLLREAVTPSFMGDSKQLFEPLIESAVLKILERAPLGAATLAAYQRSRKVSHPRSLCFAPSSSMYFGQNGRVSACCYTRAVPIGHYPEESVAKIWSGRRVNFMRNELEQNKLPVGCDKCADQILAQNYTGLLAASFDLDLLLPTERSGTADASVDYPTCMEFELSNKCNLECVMCSGFCSSSIRANREGLPALPQVYDARFIEELREFLPHLKVAKFFGGEPFLIDLYYRIWDILIDVNPRCLIQITSNGTVFTPKVQRLLEKLSCRVTVSLDSVTKATYEGIRKNATLESTLANLDKFKAMNRERGSEVSMNVCPMVTNWREIPGIVEFANTKQIPLFFTTVTYPEDAAIKFMPQADKEAALETFRSGLRRPRNEIEAGNLRALEDLCRQMERWTREVNVQPGVVQNVSSSALHILQQ